MKFRQFLNEFSYKFGGETITFIDIDDTLFHTFAKIKVMKDGKMVRELDNQQFNTYDLQDGESFDFGEFSDAKLFAKTSIPIPKTVSRIKKMVKEVKKGGSTIIFLTARADFDDKKLFLQTFRDHGIEVDHTYVERVGNMKSGTVSERKKKTIMKYLNTGKYTVVKMIDDDIKNVRDFSKMGKSLPQSVYDKVRQYHSLPDDEMVDIDFMALLVDENGKLKRV